MKKMYCAIAFTCMGALAGCVSSPDQVDSATTPTTQKATMLNKASGHVFNTAEFPAIAPSQRLHLILLGVDNVAKATMFYESLGWTKSPTSNDGFTKFNLGGYALCLINRADFAKDAQAPVATSTGFSGVALIYLAKSPEEVPAILARAQQAGGTIVKPATRTNWGIAGYFKDPDGHLFEVDYENAWVFDAEHRLEVDKVNGP